MINRRNSIRRGSYGSPLADPRNRKVEGTKGRESGTSLSDIGESVEEGVHGSINL